MNAKHIPEAFESRGQLEAYLKANHAPRQPSYLRAIGKAIIGAGAAAIAGVAISKAAESFSREEYKGPLPPEPGMRILDDGTLDGLEKELAGLPVTYKTNDFSEDTDEVLLARMIFGEARNCSDIEKIAVAYTAVNRANDCKRWNGATVREAVLNPWQYSCFNENDINRQKLIDPEKHDAKSWRKCLEIAEGVISGRYKDPSGGATHYFNPEHASPSWAKELKEIGRINTEEGMSRHVFYKEVSSRQK